MATRWQHIKAALGFRAQGLSDIRHPTAWLNDWALGRATIAGVHASPQTALTLSTYYACVRAISEDVGKLPLITYRRLTPRGKERLSNHPLFDVLHSAPNEDMTAMTFREVLTHHMVAWGNGYAEIVRDGQGQPAELYPIHPSRVIIRREEGQLVYDVKSSDVSFIQGATTRTEAVRFRARDILHVKGLGPEGLTGYSVAGLAAESLGLTMAAQTFGAAFFGNSTQLSGVLEHPATLSPQALEHLRESWSARYQSPANAFKPAILEEGMKWTRIGIPPNEAQFLETRSFQVKEIARWFRMPLHKIQDMDQASLNNIEQMAVEYVSDTLMPWLVRWEQELKRKLFANEPDVFAEHLVLGLLRGDQQARADYFSRRFQMGSLSPNDIRELENENPIESAAGDEYYIQSNMTTLDIVAGVGQEEPEPMPFPPQIPGQNGSAHHAHADT